MTALVNIQNVNKAYANHRALIDVSMEIPTGSVFGLLGPNGAGKTSLIRILTQITAPDTGTILFEGKALLPSHMEQVGYLPEERGLYKKMEVGEHSIYLARLKGLGPAEAKRKLRYWFEKFEIQEWWNKKIGDLSKGMQQKVQFIVTIIHEPRLLILDEPFTGFDPINANLIKDELLALNKQGTTIILSTHRMESVEELCSHIALINRSEKLLDGPVKQIRNEYKSNTWQVTYTGNAIGFTHNLWTGAELLNSHNDGEHNIAVVRLMNNTTTNDLLRSVMGDCNIVGLREMVPDMNEIFITSVNDKNKQIPA